MIYGIDNNRMGEHRIIVGFALLPVKLSNGQKIWLERYIEVQRLCGTSMMGEPSQPPLAWTTIERKPYHDR